LPKDSVVDVTPIATIDRNVVEARFPNGCSGQTNTGL